MNRCALSDLLRLLPSDHYRRQAVINPVSLRSLNHGLKGPSRFSLSGAQHRRLLNDKYRPPLTNVLHRRFLRSEFCLRPAEKCRKSSLILSNRA
jgi:hypothetical protein